MTADENVRDQLADWLFGLYGRTPGFYEWEDRPERVRSAWRAKADELLATPTVTRLLDAARAEGARTALHDAADEYRNGPHITIVPRWLRDRAEAIPTTEPDTRQCPATHDDGYRCQAFTAHEKHVDSIGRMW